MNRASLLVIGALLELAAGSSLLALPKQTTALLVDINVGPEALTPSQMLGAALLSMGIMLFFVAKSKEKQTLNGVTIAYILYNLAGIGVMTFGALSRGHDGPMLWPTIALHTLIVVLLLRAHWKERE